MPDLLEPPTQPSAEIAQNPPRRGFIINRENAREMSARGNAAKARRLQELRDAAKPPPPNPNDPFTLRRLARVRGQLDKLDGMIEHELDPQKLDRLASAQMRLAEQERILDGRPLPGSRRPAQDRAPRADSARPLPLVPPVAVVAPVEAPAPAKPMGWEYDDPAGLVREVAQVAPVAEPPVVGVQ